MAMVILFVLPATIFILWIAYRFYEAAGTGDDSWKSGLAIVGIIAFLSLLESTA